MPDLTFLHDSPFYELTALLMLASIAGFIGLWLRQPMIVSFIAVGVLAGPSALGVIESHENIALLAELGIAVLLFLVGLKLDLKLVRTLGAVSLATGVGQVLFTSVFGLVIGLAMGFSLITSLYVAVALTFSSTIIIIKLLSDKHEVDDLHGRIALGFLIVQDIIVVLAMIVLSAIGVGADVSAENSVVLQIALVLFYGLIMLIFVGLFTRYAATPIMTRIAYSSELMIIFALGWAALLASLGDHFGFSKELGGLLAGVSLASTPFREAIVARLSSLRDFLLLFFFIALGSQLDLSMLGDQLGPALIFSLFVLIGNPLIVLIILGYMGYRKRTSFLAGLTVAQISEFSLIFMAMGLTIGHVSAESLGLVTLVGLITIALSVYMITYSQVLYRWLEPVLGIFERKTPYREEDIERQRITKTSYDVILFGLGRYGNAMIQHLSEENFKVLAVDYNPDTVRRWRKLGYDTIYGDAFDHEFIAGLPLNRVKWVITAMPQHDVGITHEDPRLALIEGLKQQGYKGKIAVSTNHPHEATTLEAKGADLIILPFHDAADLTIKRIKAIETKT
jgi:Kef-type K+ transport system membrane component KefB